MGIYPERRYERQTSERRAPAVLHLIEEPGFKTTFVYELVAVIEERTNCYCCTCPDGVLYSDPACRNHGFAASRPCEEHGMPGSTWSEEMCTDECRGTQHGAGCRTGTMPTSVQAVRQRRREREEREERRQRAQKA